MRGADSLGRVRAGLTSPQAKKFVISVVAFGVAVGLFVLIALTRGVVDAIVYTFLFVFSLTLLPVLIGLLGEAMVGSKTLGKLHIILGALAFDHHFLVEREDQWEWCPGERTEEGVRVWIDGEYHHVTDGIENLSVLGWRPFGILPYKETSTWSQQRVDEKAKKQRGVASADGGESAREIAGWGVKEPPIKSGVDGTWVLDLKRVYTRGVKKIGDIALIETAEEIIERGQVDDSRLSGWRPAIEMAMGIVLGLVAAGVYVGISG